MSTKTTFKRVALVAVASLGFGGLSVVTAPMANAVAASMTVDVSSFTVVGTPVAGRPMAAYRFTVLDSLGVPVQLASTETITLTIKATGLPATRTSANPPLVGDYTFEDVTDNYLLASDTFATTYLGNQSPARTNGAIAAVNGYCDANDGTDAADNLGSYCQSVVATSATEGVDQGTYTITADLTRGSTVITRLELKFASVSTAADAGAVITVATAGTLVTGAASLNSSTSYMKATVRDVNGGFIRNVDTAAAGIAPVLETTLENAAGTVSQTLLSSDTGVSTFDHTPTTGTVKGDGVYGLTAGNEGVSSSLSLTAASVVRVRYGQTNSVGAISVLATPSASPSSSSRSVTATGLYTATETTTASNAQTYNVPLTTSSVVIKITAKNSSGTALANAPITFTTTWSGVNSGDVTPVSGSTGAKIVYTDSTGAASLTVTQANAVTGSTASIAIAGAATGTGLGGFGTTTIAWLAPAVTTFSVSPSSAFKAVAASSVTITVTAKDQFNNAMAGVVIQPSLSTASANYTTAARATVTTGADGKATVTVTAGAALTSDAWTFSSGSATPKTLTASYVAALPVIATLTGYYNTDETASTYPNLFSTTAIGATSAQLIERGLNYGASITALATGVATDTRNIFRIAAVDSTGTAVTGVPVEVTTSSAGGWMNDSCTGAAAKPVTKMTCYPDATGYIYVKTIATATGTITYTATAGTVSTSQALVSGNAATDARTVKLVVSGSDVTASVTDRFGNGVADQSVQVTVTGGSLTGGSKIATYTTDASGNFGFGVEGASTVTARLASANDSESVAGKTSTTTIDSSVAAGVRSASATVVGTDSSSSVAQAAADAAAEATDAANAATDAANAAAEAADAATAAAQDAADAVAALSAQVATLISGLKAQLTALTNLVIKIQKKVKA